MDVILPGPPRVIVPLPRRLEGLTLSKVIDHIVDNSSDVLPSRIHFDFSPLSFIKPTGVVFLSNLSYWLMQKGTEVGFLNIDGPSEALRYLDDSQFFLQHCGRVRDGSRVRGTTQPLLRIARDESHGWLRLTLLPWLAGRLRLSIASFHALQVSISELFNNIKDHTRFDIGSIFVQHFPNENRVLIAVSDFGLGIPENVRGVHPEISDADAILAAVKNGFTTRSVDTNEGIGLDYLLQTVVGVNGGEVTFYSLRAIVKFTQGAVGIVGTKFNNVGYCPGTTIEISLRTDTIEALEEESEDLEW